MNGDGSPSHLRPPRHHGTPQPLRTGHWALRYRRVDVVVYNGTDAVKAPGSFETYFDAKRWADRVHPSAASILVVGFRRDDSGVQFIPMEAILRQHGEWSDAENPASTIDAPRGTSGQTGQTG